MIEQPEWIDVDRYYDGYLSGYFLRDEQLHAFRAHETWRQLGDEPRTYDVWRVEARDFNGYDQPADFTMSEDELNAIPYLPDTWIDALSKRNEERNDS